MRKEALDFPKSILIETFNVCQGECKFCPYKDIRATEEPIYLDYERYKELIEEISRHDVKRLTLFNNNEPLIDKRIFDFIKYARDKLDKMEITLSTNGILLTKELLYKLKEAGLTYLYVSIPSVNDEYYTELMGRSIKKLLNILTDIKDKELIKMIRIAVPKTKYYDHESLKQQLGQYLICVWDLEYKENWNIQKKFNSIVDEIEYTGPCDRPLDQMVISSNGNVIICCRDWNYENVVGNIYDNTIYDIWHNKIMKKIQRLIIEQNYNAIDCCKDCNMNNKYYNEIKRRTYEKK